MVSGKSILECPFCNKAGVKAFHKPGYLEHKKSSISSESKITYYRVPESYAVQGSCPNCGKSEKEIQKALDTGITKKLSHEERLKRLKEAGLPTEIETKV